MRLWKRAFEALKDQNSIWIASLARRTSLRNLEIEAAVIKATNHDEFFMDTESIAFVYRLLRLSSAHHKPIMWAISTRMAKTRSWVVALKGLILMHGIFACKIPSIQKMGRLPFDLSCFKDGHSNPEKTWPHNNFIRSYYSFLDQKSAFLATRAVNNVKSLKDEFGVIHKLQGLLDLLLEIKPQTDATVAHPLFVEAIDCVIVEVFDVYSQICSGISKFLVNICSVGKVEAAMALKIIQKTTNQGDELSQYFEICKEIGVMNASDCPRVDKISKEDMKDLEDIINGGIVGEDLNEAHHDNDNSKQIVLRDPLHVALINEQNEYQSKMMTIITHNWEKFDEDFTAKESAPKGKNPFEDFPELPPKQVSRQCDDVPDLIIL
ncbi:hypothetical protein Leryth_026385 [Lithospermum erythrorhizon]|nr:hypothetical protein Leryth_026385 [Lithospermum erythrorhizon]